jgi:hypothetical protein
MVSIGKYFIIPAVGGIYRCRVLVSFDAGAAYVTNEVRCA